MSQYQSQVQNMFLSSCRKRHQPVEVTLNTGTSLRGKIKGFDQFSISLSFRDKVEVIYKSAILIITVLPRKPRPVRRPPGPFRPGEASRVPRPGLRSDRYDPGADRLNRSEAPDLPSQPEPEDSPERPIRPERPDVPIPAERPVRTPRPDRAGTTPRVTPPKRVPPPILIDEDHDPPPPKKPPKR